MSRLVLVGRDDVGNAVRRFPDITAMLQRGIERSGGTMTLQSVGDGLRTDALQLWLTLVETPPEVTLAGIGLTHLGFEPSGLKSCTVYLCGGRMRSETGHMAAVEAWARDEEKCDRMVIYARKGWARELPDYALSQYVLTKSLKDIDHGGRRQSTGHDDEKRPLRSGDPAHGHDPGQEPGPLQPGGTEPVHGTESRRVH